MAIVVGKLTKKKDIVGLKDTALIRYLCQNINILSQKHHKGLQQETVWVLVEIHARLGVKLNKADAEIIIAEAID